MSPDVDLSRLRVSDRDDLAFLEDAEELRLHRRRGLADLVEEERAAVRRLEEPFPVAGGSRERAPSMPEQLALEEVLREGRTVHRDEEALAPRAPLVQGARDPLLAGAGLAGQEDGCRGRCDAIDVSPDLAHRRARSHHVVAGGLASVADAEVLVLAREALVRALEGFEQPLVLVLEMVHLDRSAERESELGRLPGLGDVAVDPARVDRFDEDADVGVAGQDDPDEARPPLHAAGEQLETRHPGHALIGHDHRHLRGGEDLERSRTVLRAEDLEVAAKAEPEGREDVGLVVHDEDRVGSVVDRLHRRLALLARPPSPGQPHGSIVAPAPRSPARYRTRARTGPRRS
jgi:hypothetical protein